MGAFPDPAHDFNHVLRVVSNAKRLQEAEGGDLSIIIPAAYLHDFVLIQKSDPRRPHASRLSADAAKEFLKEVLGTNATADYLGKVGHAIEAHSFSSKIEAITLEAKIVQDADRLDGLGSIGIARCFSLSGLLLRDSYHSGDPFCESRPPDDRNFTLNHFFSKLLKVKDQMHTASGRKEAERRTDFIKSFLGQLKAEEISAHGPV